MHDSHFSYIAKHVTRQAISDQFTAVTHSHITGKIIFSSLGT